MSLLPVRLYFRTIRKSYGSEALFSTVGKVSLINCTIVIEILSPAILFSFDPLTFILIKIWIPHSPFALFYIILPFSLIYVSI